jgi:hypothetical protein
MMRGRSCQHHWQAALNRQRKKTPSYRDCARLPDSEATPRLAGLTPVRKLGTTVLWRWWRDTLSPLDTRGVAVIKVNVNYGYCFSAVISIC